MTMNTKSIKIASIRIDGGTQARASLDQSTVHEYAEAMERGDSFPPVVVYFDGSAYWLADGFHRYFGSQKIGALNIDADVRNGTKRDAILFSLSANANHGLRRTNADKRKAVETLLADEEWSKWSDRKIADACGVSHEFVRQRRETICQPLTDSPTRTVERNGSTYTQNTANIGKAKPVESDSTTAPKPAARQVEQKPEAVPTDADELAELHHTITDLAAENERLSDRLAVEAMDASEEEKTAAAQTIAELRNQVSTMEAELSAVKASRDTYMRENKELKKQVNYWRKQAEKAAA